MGNRAAPCYLRFGQHKLPVPRSKLLRVALGSALLIGAALPLIPPGVGGVPVALALLSIDFPRLRRPRRQMLVWGGRKLQRWTKSFDAAAAPRPVFPPISVVG